MRPLARTVAATVAPMAMAGMSPTMWGCRSLRSRGEGVFSQAVLLLTE